MKKVYIASPLGFSEAGRYFLYEKLIPLVEQKGCAILDPWKLTDSEEILKVERIESFEERKKAWQEVNELIGGNNVRAIDSCDIILSILDGSDIDSGTASEIGYGAAKGKTIIGYRGDFRMSGDNEGSTVNLQVEYFIRQSGGCMVSNIDELNSALGKYLKVHGINK